MWKYVSRRIRDTFERSVNHFDKRSSAGLVNSTGNFTEEQKPKPAAGPPCRWFSPRKCWDSFSSDNDTNSNRWNFEHLNRTWIGAITWSSALVLGWYTSQLIHLKLKHYCSKEERNRCLSTYKLFSSLQPNVNKNEIYLNSSSKIEKVLATFAPTIHLVSNEQDSSNRGKASTSLSSTSTDSSDNDLADVLNSIENRLGLAAIENGQHHDGLNLLRSAANRNHAPAQYNLGLCYEMGLGVTVDEKIAMELYRSAAALQHPGALYNLGIYYGQGRGGLNRDVGTATRLLRLAAIQGQKDAIDALKVLDIDLTELPRENDIDPWSYGFSAFLPNDNVVPIPTTLFVENLNFLQECNTKSTVY